MKFKDIEYVRPNLSEVANDFEKLAQEAKQASNGQELLALFDKSDSIRKDCITAQKISMIRHTIDTTDEFYDEENSYFDHNTPAVYDGILNFYRALLESPHKQAVGEKHGQVLLDLLSIQVKSSMKELIPLQQEENALSSEYQKLYASARIPFQGKELTVSQLSPYKQDISRTVRKEAVFAEGGFFDSIQEQLDEIYDKMVKNRTEQAAIMGYDNFTPLGDLALSRYGYTRDDIQRCRAGVEKSIVPVVQKIRQNQAKRIGLDAITYYDEKLFFKDGNPIPTGTSDEIVAAGQKMYRELSPETAEFIDYMMEGEYFDLLSKPGKAPGGYCSRIENYKAPFIFSNFNGTADDVDVFTHEAGHAFAAYIAMRKDIPGVLYSPGMESCEIHSMSMEFLTSDYHHLFFKENTEKYQLFHAESGLIFLPYGCMVDEFQQEVYTRPHLTPKQRNQLWLELNKRYMPEISLDNIPFYGRGAGWQRQIHIYEYPFYYIDYVLAQTVAFQFFLASNNNKQEAWERYLALINKAGTESYTGLVHAAGFKSPFEEGVMEQIGSEMYNWLNAHPLF